MTKKIIADWDNEYTIYDWLKECREQYMDNDPEFIETQVAEFLKYNSEEDAVAQYANTYNDLMSLRLDDERHNLNMQLRHPLIAFGHVGRWNGRLEAYWKAMDKYNLADILDIPKDDTWTIYGDDEEGEVVYFGVHHDGQNLLTIRKWNDNLTHDEVEDLKDRFIEAFEMNRYSECRKIIDEYTESLYPLVGKIYGWN